MNSNELTIKVGSSCRPTRTQMVEHYGLDFAKRYIEGSPHWDYQCNSCNSFEPVNSKSKDWGRCVRKGTPGYIHTKKHNLIPASVGCYFHSKYENEQTSLF